MRKMRLKKDKPRAFFHHEKIPGNEVERRVPPQKPENLSLALLLFREEAFTIGANEKKKN
jgi:hypothetical protein